MTEGALAVAGFVLFELAAAVSTYRAKLIKGEPHVPAIAAAVETWACFVGITLVAWAALRMFL